MSSTATDTAANGTTGNGNGGQDYTLDPSSATPGSLIFLHGYQPAILLAVEDDGSVEVARFGTVEFHPASDFSTHRGPRPSSLGPPELESGDRIASLENQVATLLELLRAQGIAPAAPPAAADAPPAEGGSPFGSFSSSTEAPA